MSKFYIGNKLILDSKNIKTGKLEDNEGVFLDRKTFESIINRIAILEEKILEK